MSKFGSAVGADFPADPIATDDCLSGFYRGFLWRNTVTNAIFRCNENAPGVAVWQQLSTGTDTALVARVTALEARVTALEAGGIPGGSAPANTALPAVTGSTNVGSVLTTTNGAWSGGPTGYAYQWKRNGVAIVGATANTYTIQVGDVGATILCTVTATNGTGSTSANSNGVTATAPSTAQRQSYALGLMGPFIINQTGTRQYYAKGLIINE